MVNKSISRPFKWCWSSGWALLIAVAVVTLLSACVTPIEPKARVAQILETQIVVRGEGSAKWHYFEFNAPEAGPATLRLSNGAKTGASFSERVLGVKVTLNGEPVVSRPLFFWLYDILDVPLDLQAGPNTLAVRPSRLKVLGKRLSVRIDAPADDIVLTPIRNPVVLGRDPLRARATVTGLGVPVRRAKVRFEVLDLGSVPKGSSTTDRAGVATAYLRGFGKAGEGQLKVSVAETALSHEIPIQAVKALAITLDHGVDRLSLKEGDEAAVAIAVNVLKDGQEGHHVTLGRVIEPDPEGITFDLPAGGDIGPEPQLPFKGKVTGITAGTYTVTTTATIMETGDKWSDTLTIDVVDPDAPDPLLLAVPSVNPPGIPPGAPSTVTVLALVDGTSTPPEVLFLDEVDAQGKPLSEPVGDCDDPKATCLQDDGKDEDKHAGDLAYTGTLDIPSPVKGEKYFRVRAEYFGKTVISGSETFSITPFPLKARLSKGPLVDDQFFANEVILKVRPGVLPDRVETIAAAAPGGIVVGVIPPLRTYLVQITGDGTANGVQAAIAAMSAFDNEVERVSPNHVVKPLAFPQDPPDDPGYCDSSTPCTCAEPPCQWHLPKVNAREAWQLAGGGDPLKTGVAVLDGGVKCVHEDLADDPTTTPEVEAKCAHDDDDSGQIPHGTWVAGIIAATANNGKHIAGVAWNTELYDYRITSVYPLNERISNVIANEPLAMIINISNHKNCPTSSTALVDAVRDAIVNKHRLVVTGSGNGCIPQAVCPADYNTQSDLKDGLLVVGATDDTDAPGYDYTCNNAYKMDLYAPGIAIRTIGLNNTDRPAPSGTSMATAIASGAAAVLWASDFDSTGTTRAKAVHDRLIRTATPLTGYDHCQDIIDPTVATTCGRLDLFEAVKPSEFDITPASALEGASVEFTVTRTGDAPAVQTVDYATSISAGDTAQSSDFTAASSPPPLIFLEGHVTKTVTVNTTDDALFEPDETFTATLSNPTGGAALGVATAQGTIVNNDDPCAAVNLDFETRADGTPFAGVSDRFPEDEYVGSGVRFTDSDPAVGTTFVNLTNPVNVGTAISGYYVNLGVFAGIEPTFIEIEFTCGTSNVNFDFAIPDGFQLRVRAFNLADTQIIDSFFTGSNTFINRAGFPMKSGSALVSSVQTIRRIRIESSTAIILDNLH